MGGANVSPWVEPTKKSRNSERAVFSWHWGRDIHTTVFDDCAGVQVITAHLRRAACPFDVWILQMKSRGETEMNHLRFWKSFRTDWLSKLIGGENGLIFLRSAASDSLSLSFYKCVWGKSRKRERERVAWVSQKINRHKIFKLKKKRH